MKARETALAAKEKAKDLASQAQKKQYVWWAQTPGGSPSTSEKGHHTRRDMDLARSWDDQITPVWILQMRLVKPMCSSTEILQ